VLSVGVDRSRPRAIEDYVKAIDYLAGERAVVRAVDVAHHLKISAASVSQFRPVLLADGLIATGAALRLTARGRALAHKMNRRHGVIETFLHESLAVPLDRLHAEAERLEHVMSDDVVERLAALTGDPACNPLGHAIPRRDVTRRSARIPARSFSLARTEPGASVVVASIDDDDSACVRALAARRVLPGLAATVTSVGERGEVRLRAGGGRVIALPPSLASRVRCVHPSTNDGGAP